MKRSAYQQNIDEKESNLKVHESKRNRLQLVVTACKKERDSVGLYLTDENVYQVTIQKLEKDKTELGILKEARELHEPVK